MKPFLCFDLAVELYSDCKKLRLKAFMKDQLLRAASSIALNLSEGNARLTQKDKRRFVNIALGSLREVQAIIKLEDINDLTAKADRLGAMIYRLQLNLTNRTDPEK